VVLYFILFYLMGKKIHRDETNDDEGGKTSLFLAVVLF